MSEVPKLWADSNPQAINVRTEDDLHRFFLNLFYEVREAQKPLAEKWARFDRFWRGKQWERNLEAWRAQIVRNSCFQIVESQLPTLCTAEARMCVVPVEGGDQETAEGLDDIINYLNWKHSWFKTTIMAQKTALKLGGAILKTGWDKSLGYSGDASYSYVLPYLFLPDPDALTLEECNFVFEVKALTLAEIRYLHPKKGKRVKPDFTQLDSLLFKGEAVGKGPLVPQVRVAEELHALPKSDGMRLRDEYLGKALYIECWFRDYTTVREGKRERLLYPGGRHVVFTQDLILVDEPNPFWHRRWPYVLLPDYPDDENFWPIGELELILTLQQLQNKAISQVVDNLTIFGNPVWIIDDQSGVRADTIDNSPNAVIRKVQGTEVRRDDPPNLPPYVIEMATRIQHDIEDITGAHDIIQGRRPEGVRAYSAIRQLLEAAEQRLRLKLIWQQEALRQAARQITSNVMQYYTHERFMRILGRKKVERMIRSRLAQGLNVDEKGKAVEDRLVFNLEEAYEAYDYASETEVMTHNTRQLMRDMARDLYAIKAIDREALLKMLGVPGWEEIIERMEGRKPGAPPSPLRAEAGREAVPELGEAQPPPPETPPAPQELAGLMQEMAT